MTTQVIQQDELIVVGGFMRSSWGYDQTNVDFYKVVRRTEKTVWLLEVQAESVWSEDGYRVLGVVPVDKSKLDHDHTLCTFDGEWHEHPREDIGCYVEKILRRKIQSFPSNGVLRESVRIESYAGAYPCDTETPQFDTIATGGMGH